MAHDQPGADLEERLAVAIGQLVEDYSSGWIGEGSEDLVVVSGVCHVGSICKLWLACQTPVVGSQDSTCRVSLGT